MSEKTTKDLLIEKAVAAGLGEAKTFSNISEANLETMVKTIEDRDGEIEVLKKATPAADKKNKKVTTVNDLVRLKKIETAKVPTEPAKIKGEFIKETDKE